MPTTQPGLNPRSDIPGVANFAQVSDQLWRGEQPTAEGFKTLKQMGVKTIVNLRTFHSDRRELTGLGLQYVHIYCKAWHPEEEDVVKFLTVMADLKNHPVFVHCMQGSDRTGMMCAAYRMVNQDWNTTDALAELPRFGFHTIWKDIQTYLKNFETKRVRSLVQSAGQIDVETVK